MHLYHACTMYHPYASSVSLQHYCCSSYEPITGSLLPVYSMLGPLVQCNVTLLGEVGVLGNRLLQWPALLLVRVKWLH